MTVASQSTPCLRRHLQWIKIQGDWNCWWVVFDPLAEKYYRCSDDEALVLQSCVGVAASSQLVQSLQQKYGAERFPADRIAAIVRFAGAVNLLQPDNGDEFSASTKSTTPISKLSFFIEAFAAFRSTASLILYNRIPLASPNRVAAFFAVRTDWLFGTKACQYWYAFIIVCYAILIANLYRFNFDSWSSAVDIHSALTLRTWFGCIAVLAVTRILHEWGHAVVCLRNGGRCNEIGFVRILMIAFPYVDVTDAWKMPAKSDRIGVWLAGIYVESIISAFSILVWIATEASLLHTLAFQTLVVTIGSALLFNANPLMKYDGYYVLSEWLEVPDLQRGSRQAWHKIRQKPQSIITNRYATGSADWLTQAPMATRIGLLFYGIAAPVYRAGLSFGLMVALVSTFAAYGMSDVGWSLALSILLSSVLIFALRKVTRIKAMLQTNSSASFRASAILQSIIVSLSLALMVAVVWCVLWLPLPNRLYAVGAICTVGRNFVTLTTPSTTLKSFDTFAEDIQVNFDHPESERKILALEQGIVALQAKERVLLQAAYLRPDVLEQLDQLHVLQGLRADQYDSTLEQVNQYRLSFTGKQMFSPIGLDTGEERYLTSVAAAGIRSQQVELLTVASRGAVGMRLKSGQRIGYLREGKRVPSVLTYVSQADRAELFVGQKANVQLAQRPHEIFVATVSSVSQLTNQIGSDTVDAAVQQHTQQTAIDPTAKADPSPLQLGYNVMLTFDDESNVMLASTDASNSIRTSLEFVEDGKCDVVFKCESRSLIARLGDWVQNISRH